MADERSTRRWAVLRAAVGATLPQLRARCGLLILPGQPWDRDTLSG